MRVLHVNDHLAAKGGVETYLLSVIPELESAGHTQGVAFTTGDQSLVADSFQVSCLSDAGGMPTKQVHQQLDQVLDQFQPDLIHLHSIYNADAIEYLLDRKPVVLTSHDYRYLCPTSSFYYRRTETECQRTCSAACFGVTLIKKCMTLRPGYSLNYFRRVQRVISRLGDFQHLIAPSQSAADRYRKNGFPADRITVLPYFCRINPLSEPRPVPVQQMILYLGRLSPNKGWHYFVEALAKLPGNVRGMIVGNMKPDVEQALRLRSQRLGLQDRLSWRTWASAEEIEQIFHQTTAMVFPSLWPETLGIVGLEAMAHGVPVVASDIGGVREWLIDDETGFLVKPGDSSALADRLSQIVSSPERNLRFGERAIGHLNRRFLPNRHLNELLHIYENAVTPKQDSYVGSGS